MPLTPDNEEHFDPSPLTIKTREERQERAKYSNPEHHTLHASSMRNFVLKAITGFNVTLNNICLQHLPHLAPDFIDLSERTKLLEVKVRQEIDKYTEAHHKANPKLR